MSKNKMHLMFSGLGAGNIGDETMFSGFVSHYSLPNRSTVEVFDTSSEIIKTLPSQFHYVDYNKDDENCKAAESAQTVLLVGGTPVSIDLGLDWPMRVLGKRLRFCHSRNIPVYAIGVGIDYLFDEEAKKLFFDAFSPIVSWSVRSIDCRKSLLSLGIPEERITVAADLGWLFEPNMEHRQWAVSIFKNIGIDISKPIIGVNVVNEKWSGQTNVKLSIANALDRIIKDFKVQVLFLCNETRDGEYFDIAATYEVISKMDNDVFLIPNHYFVPSQMLSLLSFCTITISQRYHFTLLSYLADTLPLSFARMHKMTSLLKEFGDEPLGTMDSCNTTFIEKRIKEALKNYTNLKNRNHKIVTALKERAKKNFIIINKINCDNPSLLKVPLSSKLSEKKINYPEMEEIDIIKENLHLKKNIMQYENILIPRFDTFGDIVLLNGFLKGLLCLLPKAQITLLVRNDYKQLAALFPSRLKWKTTHINPYKESPDYKRIEPLLVELNNDKYDLLLCTTYDRTWLDELIAAKISFVERVAFKNQIDFTNYLSVTLAQLDILSSNKFYDQYISVHEQEHETEKYQEFWFELTGKKESLPIPQLSLSTSLTQNAELELSKRGLIKGKFFFCFPAGSANHSLKLWSEEKYAEVITILEKKYGLKSLVAGHISERNIIEKVISLSIMKGSKPEFWLGKSGDIPLSCALVEKSLFYFGNDTGLMHMAAALNKPVFALFGGGTWPRFLPCFKVGRVFHYRMPCYYCKWECVFEKPYCIESLSVDFVVDELSSTIEKILENDCDFKIVEERSNFDQVYTFLKKAITQINLKRQDTEYFKNKLSRSNAELKDIQKQLNNAEHDRAERLNVIKTQGEMISQLENEIHLKIKDNKKLWRRINELEPECNNLRFELSDVKHQFEESELDRETRLKVIENQGKEIARLNEEVHRWLEECENLWKRVNKLEPECNNLRFELSDVKRQFEESELDREARLKVIENQGKEIARLNEEVHRWLEECKKLWKHVNELEDLNKFFRR